MAKKEFVSTARSKKKRDILEDFEQKNRDCPYFIHICADFF